MQLGHGLRCPCQIGREYRWQLRNQSGVPKRRKQNKLRDAGVALEQRPTLAVPAPCSQLDDRGGSGGGIRTPDTRIMMPGLCPANQKFNRANPVKPASKDQKLSGSLSNRSVDGVELSKIPKSEPSSQTRVREPNRTRPARATSLDAPSLPAHPSNRLIAQLNANWRVVHHPLQWILQRRKGNPRKKNSGWQHRSFCTTREALLRCVRESCGEVDQVALTALQALTDHHFSAEQMK